MHRMSSSGTPTQTVILAAGSGSRLGSAASGVPKPLITVGGVPLIAHTLRHARQSGCLRAIIVVGHEGARVRAVAETIDAGLSIQFVESPDPNAPNGVSLLAAEPLAASQFFLQMVDHLFVDIALPRLVASPLGAADAGRVLVDRAPRAPGMIAAIDLDDATRVRLDGDRVTAIGKGLDPWDAIDAGCFVLTPRVFDALRRVPATEPRTVSSGMRQLVLAGSLGSADVRGTGWVDVDTPADRDLAETLVRRVSDRQLTVNS